MRLAMVRVHDVRLAHRGQDDLHRDRVLCLAREVQAPVCSPGRAWHTLRCLYVNV